MTEWTNERTNTCYVRTGKWPVNVQTGNRTAVSFKIKAYLLLLLLLLLLSWSSSSLALCCHHPCLHYSSLFLLFYCCCLYYCCCNNYCCYCYFIFSFFRRFRVVVVAIAYRKSKNIFSVCLLVMTVCCYPHCTRGTHCAHPITTIWNSHVSLRSPHNDDLKQPRLIALTP